MPNCGNSKSRLSKEHSEPDGFFPPFSDVNHWASRTFTTNQPSPAGARPEPESLSGASRTARVYKVAGKAGTVRSRRTEHAHPHPQGGVNTRRPRGRRYRPNS